MFSYTVTIGRNIKGKPMPSNKWLRFIDTVTEDMDCLLIPIYGDAIEIHHGTGTWNGITEESVKITVLTNYEPTKNQLEAVKGFLKLNATEFKQDAIAFTVGNAELITS